MNKQFTDGKWFVEGHNKTAVMAELDSIPGPTYNLICHCNFGDSKTAKYLETNQANAMLIANAPAMFELLEKFIKACQDNDIAQLVPEYEQAVTLLTRITTP